MIATPAEARLEDPAWREEARNIALSVCRSRRCFWLEEDAEAAALVILWECSRDFDPARGVRFEVYLGVRVRGAVLDLMRREHTAGVWCPRSKRHLAPKTRHTDWQTLPDNAPVREVRQTPPEPMDPRPSGARAVEERDAAADLARRAGGRLVAEVLMATLVDGEAPEAVSVRLGFNPGRAYQIRAAALAELRDQFERARRLAEADRVA